MKGANWFERVASAALITACSSYLPGCAIIQTREFMNEKLEISMAVLPFVGGAAKIKHDIYGSDGIESAIDSEVGVSSLNSGNAKVQVYGAGRKKEWEYEIKKGLGENLEATVITKDGKKQKFENVPEWLPSKISYQDGEWITYSGPKGEIIDYKRLKDVFKK
jgi:hypothetical protein